MVPYMYGELSSADVSVFESHLLDCAACTDEFAEISNARYEVYDWKKLAFDPLPTPEFEIPRAMQPATSGEASWIDRLRAAFAKGWAVPAMAFASIAVIAGLSGMFLLRSDTDVAGVDKNEAPIVSPERVQSPTPVANAPGSGAVAVTNGGSANGEPVERRSQTPARRAEPKRAIRSVRPVQPRTVETRATRTETPNVPRLNGFDEDEDTSLRLAQLFEDVGTSD